MLLFNRILYKSGSTLTDLSNNLNDPLAGTEVIDFNHATDAIYLGSDYPFNHRHIELAVANDQASSPSISLWDGSDWSAVAEIIDLTRTGGVTLAKSGVLAWVPDRSSGWVKAYDTTQNIPELAGIRLYDLYWAKITFSADLKATLALKYVGHRFCVDSEIEARYPELADANLMDAYQTGKTDWTDQCILASEDLLKDLVGKEIINSDNQVLDWRIFNTPSIHKAAEIIYRGLGASYKEKIDLAVQAYNASSRLKIYNVDVDDDAILGIEDKQNMTGWQTR